MKISSHFLEYDLWHSWPFLFREGISIAHLYYTQLHSHPQQLQIQGNLLQLSRPLPAPFLIGGIICVALMLFSMGSRLKIFQRLNPFCQRGTSQQTGSSEANWGRFQNWVLNSCLSELGMIEISLFCLAKNIEIRFSYNAWDMHFYERRNILWKVYYFTWTDQESKKE